LPERGVHAACVAVEAADPETVVTSKLSTSATASGQPIVFPQNDPQVRVSIYEIPSGAVLPEHRHVYLRYGYVLARTLRVTCAETGDSHVCGAAISSSKPSGSGTRRRPSVLMRSNCW
jgi:quercetin dioxygenase-like cupin family protein